MADKNDEGRKQALRTARNIGCSGAHQKDGKWFPCSSHEKLLEISRLAESGKWTPPKGKAEPSGSDLIVPRSRRDRRRRRVDGWEELREAPIRSVETLPSGGLVSGKRGGFGPGRVGGWMDETDEPPVRKRGKRRTARIRLEEVERRRANSVVVPGSDMSVKKDVMDGDGDGRVFDGTPKERPATPAEVARGRARRVRKATDASRTAVRVLSPSRRGERSGRGRRVGPDGMVEDVAQSRRIRAQLRSFRGGQAGEAPYEGFMTPKKPRRFGRAPKKKEQELTEEGRRLRIANQRAFPRAVKPKNSGAEVSVAEIRSAGMESTAEYFGISGRGLDQPGVSPERAKIYNDIATAMAFGDAENPRELPVRETPTAYIMGGGPGTGKSFLRQAGFFDIPGPEEAAHIDTDEGRKLLPEYDSMFADLEREMGTGEAGVAVAGMNHEEASHVARLATNMAYEGRHDVVIDSTGDGGPDSFTARLIAAKKAGYRVEAHYATVNIQKAQEVAQKRAKEENRGVDPAVIEDTHIDVSRAVVYGITNGLFDKLTLTDNNDHDTPVVFAEMVDGVLNIYNERMWDAFVIKALMVSPKAEEYERDYFINNAVNDEILGLL